MSGIAFKDGNGVLGTLRSILAGSDQIQEVLPFLGSTITGGAPARVAQNVADVTLLASNSNRIRAHIYNDTTADLRISYGATASATQFTVLIAPGSYHIVDDFVGAIHGIWSAAGTGGANITEITP